MTKDRKRSAATRDDKLIVHLLGGRVTWDKRGLPQHHYLQDGSAEELRARRALARYLRTSRTIDFGLRCLLADMIDPACEEAERRICFKHRREGQPAKSALAQKTIAEFIRTCPGPKPIAQAVAKFELSRTSVETIWRAANPKTPPPDDTAQPLRLVALSQSTYSRVCRAS